MTPRLVLQGGHKQPARETPFQWKMSPLTLEPQGSIDDTDGHRLRGDGNVQGYFMLRGFSHAVSANL